MTKNKTLLIVSNIPSPNTQALAEAAVRGASHADISNIGREDFFEKSELLRKEEGAGEEIFLQKTFELLNSHQWLTPAARRLRHDKKQENIRALAHRLRGGHGGDRRCW